MRGRRPSPSAKFWRSTSSTCAATRSLSDLGLAHHGLELAPHDIDVERGAGVLQGQQADAERARDERRAVVGAGARRTKVARPGIEQASGARWSMRCRWTLTWSARGGRAQAAGRCWRLPCADRDVACATFAWHALGYPADDARPHRPRSLGQGRLDAGPRRWPCGSRLGGHGHRPAPAQGGAGRARLPRATSTRARSRRRSWSSAASHTVGAWPACSRPRRSRPAPGSSASATRCIDRASPTGRCAAATGRTSTVPVLLLSGESDPFARLDLLRRAIDGAPAARAAGDVPQGRPQPQGGARRRARPGRGLRAELGAGAAP